MNVSVTVRHQNLDPAARDYAAERVTKVVRVFERLDTAQVTMDQEGDEYVVEATLTAPKGARFVARAQGRDLRAAIDAMTQKLEAQVRQWKERLTDHRHLAPQETPPSTSEEAGPGEGPTPPTGPAGG